MLIQELEKRNLIQTPKWLSTNCSYLTIMGSVAYGVSSDTSDCDVYGFAIPPKDEVFPHLKGEILGFGKQKKRFDQWQETAIYDKNAAAGKGKNYDFAIFGIVKFFSLALDNNPNIIDSIFTPANCILHMTTVGNMVRENRKVFLHKGSWHKFKGYSYSQLNSLSKTKTDHDVVEIRTFEDKHNIPHNVKFSEVQNEYDVRYVNIVFDYNRSCLRLLNNKEFNEYYYMYKSGIEKSKRFESRKIYNTDLKFMYHVFRLLLEVEMILAEHDIDLQRHNEQLKSVRRGEWTESDIRKWAADKERQLEELYTKSTLRYGPDEPAIKALLLNCLEHHYGSLSDCIIEPDLATKTLREINQLIESRSKQLGL
jgi:predicted nucleotidyltransferase